MSNKDKDKQPAAKDKEPAKGATLAKRGENGTTGDEQQQQGADTLQRRSDASGASSTSAGTEQQQEDQAEIERRRQEQDTARGNTSEQPKGAGLDGAAHRLTDTAAFGGRPADQVTQDEIDRRRQEQDTARANAQGMTAGFSDDMHAMLKAVQDTLVNGVRDMPPADVARVMRVALFQANMLSDPASLAPADAAAINRQVLDGLNTGAALPLVDRAAMTQSELDNDLVLVNSPRAFRLRLNNGTIRKYGAGAQRMPRDHAEHWYSKQNGVKIVE